MRSQRAVSAYFTVNQILYFVFTEQYSDIGVWPRAGVSRTIRPTV